MSTLAEKRALCLISIAHGAAISIQQNYDLGPTFADRVALLCRHLNEAGRRWPVMGDRDVLPWVEEKFKLWAPDPSVTSILSLASLALHALTDLDESIEKKMRRVATDKLLLRAELLQPCIPALVAVLEEIDPQGARHDVYEETDELLRRLNKIIN